MISRKRQKRMASLEYARGIIDTASYDTYIENETIDSVIDAYEDAVTWADGTCREALAKTLEQLLDDSGMIEKILSTYDKNLGTL